MWCSAVLCSIRVVVGKTYRVVRVSHIMVCMRYWYDLLALKGTLARCSSRISLPSMQRHPETQHNTTRANIAHKQTNKHNTTQHNTETYLREALDPIEIALIQRQQPAKEAQMQYQRAHQDRQ